MRDEFAIRAGFLFLTVGLGGLISGTINEGSHPSWPSPVIWVVVASFAAAFTFAAIFRESWAFRGTAIYAAGMVAAMRGLGYIFAPSEIADFPNMAASGAYSMVVGLVALLWTLWHKPSGPAAPDPTTRPATPTDARQTHRT